MTQLKHLTTARIRSLGTLFIFCQSLTNLYLGLGLLMNLGVFVICS